MWSFWTLFRSAKYYRHFLDLVRLLNICLQFEITDDEIETLRTGFIAMYFQYNIERLPCCPVTIHGLLHIASGIKFTGPASMDRHVLETAQLTQIKTVYNVFEELSLTASRAEIPGSFSDPAYPSCVLLPPRSRATPSLAQMKTIATALSTRSGSSMRDVNNALKAAEVEEWGKVRRIDSEEGDTMRSCSLGTTAEDSRDATYVRYEMLVDKHARFKKRAPEFELQTFYGQLTHLYRVHFREACALLNTEEPTTYILAAIRACVLDADDAQLRGLDIHFYSGTGGLDVIDITSVQALVGRVPDRGDGWAIIDRSGVLARAEWLGEDE
ncbi:hypothetical protein B0H17DRAFT_1161144 [Mycena rosella]|uniref:Uncharacterized protein n=1 Tax=Mycena rosella TaxID=1033263 RepID=A0AAD7D683_MYCRO|nr:hypothetical protein B0H17DRAFT_1161144 [Mycena rosella]